jgi:hypothetical protein
MDNKAGEWKSKAQQQATAVVYQREVVTWTGRDSEK